MRSLVYLDYHGSAPLSAAARRAIAEALEARGGNPSSVHTAGRATRGALERARSAVAEAVGASIRELVFTSGGTEAVHLAVRGLGAAYAPRAVLLDRGAHPALRSAAEGVSRALGSPLCLLDASPGAPPDPDALRRALAAHPKPALVAVSLVQHETGAIADARALAAATNEHGGLLVFDAVQAFGKIPLDAGTLGAAALSLSAHKIGGPSGVGAVWIAPGILAEALLGGGAQERGLRAGTENVLGLVGFGAAAATVPERLAAMPSIARRRDRIEAALEGLTDVVINGRGAHGRVATACHASLRGLAGEELVAALDVEGFCVSSGPACASGRPGPSASLLELYPDEPWRASSALRVTLGPETTDDEVERFVRVLPMVVARVRC